MTNLAKSRLIACMLLAAPAAGCERIVSVEVPEAEAVLVVEGRLERVLGEGATTQSVRLTTTNAAFGEAAFPLVVGAVVRVTSDAGVVLDYSASPSEPGLYVSAPFQPEIDAEYTLEIDYAGESFRAVDRLHATPAIDSLYFIYQEAGFEDDSAGYRAAIDFQDPPNQANYYFWEGWVDGVLQIQPDGDNREDLISTDKTYPGQYVTGLVPYSERPVLESSQFEMRQYSISRQAYEYLFALFGVTGVGQGELFELPPANVRGNVANLSDPARRALGFFFAAEVSVATGRAPDAPPTQ